MSPSSLRRYRAERLLAREFDALRDRVIAAVRARLGACGRALDQGDLEGCYAQAWQGLYASELDGREIESPFAWLVLVTYRRAIEEQRARAPTEILGEHASCEPDLAAELDDRVRLRQLFEGLNARLSAREREAATLCYLQGLSRASAAARLGVSDARMRKLMEGRGPGRPGVARKVGALVATIRDGDWCAEQGSSMRALAYGMLDPDGERYRLALLHRSECPSCRRYVASLRGLAVVLPPALLPSALRAGALASLAARPRPPVPTAGRLAPRGSGVPVGRGVAGALPASGAAGAGSAAGGGWLLGGGPLGFKLALGCLLTLSVGAGCVALEHAAPRVPRRVLERRAGAARAVLPMARPAPAQQGVVVAAGRGPTPTAPPLAPARALAREFGPERPPTADSVPAPSPGARRALAAAYPSPSGGARDQAAARAGARGSGAGASAIAAAREFTPG